MSKVFKVVVDIYGLRDFITSSRMRNMQKAYRNDSASNIRTSMASM